MNNTTTCNAVNIYIGSFGTFTEQTAQTYLSSYATVSTSCLGGRLVQIGEESFLLNKLAKEILKQNSSPAICEALRKLYVLSDTNVATASSFVRAAAAFRDSLKLNAEVVKARRNATFQKLKEIDQKVQNDLKSSVEMVKPIDSLKPQETPRSFMSPVHNYYTAIETPKESEAERQAELRKEQEIERQEELWVLSRNKKQTEKKLETVKEALSQQEAAILQLEVTSLEKTFSQKNVGSLEESRSILKTAAQHALALQKKTSILKEIQGEEAFLRQVDKEIIPLQTEEDYAKIFDEVIKLENLPKTAPTTPMTSGRSSPNHQ